MKKKSPFDSLDGSCQEIGCERLEILHARALSTQRAESRGRGCTALARSNL